jgi:hypothetical protein
VRLYKALLAIAWPRREMFYVPDDIFRGGYFRPASEVAALRPPALPWEIPPANHGNGAFGLPDACLDDDPDAWLDEIDLD